MPHGPPAAPAKDAEEEAAEEEEEVVSAPKSKKDKKGKKGAKDMSSLFAALEEDGEWLWGRAGLTTGDLAAGLWDGASTWRVYAISVQEGC